MPPPAIPNPSEEASLQLSLPGDHRSMRTLKPYVLGLMASTLVLPVAFTQTPPEAPTGFDGLTNGFATQADMDAAKEVFDEQEELDEGLGPVYNARSCGGCHENPVSGGISQVTELRAGSFNGTNFVDHVGGSLINDRAIDASIQE